MTSRWAPTEPATAPDGPVVRIAAVGDVHIGRDHAGALAPKLADIGEHADVLLLAGDLTRRGKHDELDTLLGELADVPVPIVAVLGNHDHESGLADELAARLEDAGVRTLEGDHAVLDCGEVTLGVAGTIGFGGGFPGATCADFGEPENKAFMARSRETADSLRRALAELDTDVRVALSHYAPVRDTVRGENPEIFPFLGCYLLAEAIDEVGADVAFHGHAHHGTERGETPGGVPVRNVAQPVLGAAYRVYQLRAKSPAAAGA